MVQDDTSGAAQWPPQFKKLLESVVKLNDEFEKAFAPQSKDDCSQAKHERARYIHALKAVAAFLRANNAPLHYSQRIYYLAIALDDLKEGKVDWLLEPTPTGGVNPGSVTSQWLSQANVALGMTALTGAGNNRKQAAKEAERATGFEFSKALNWYDEFRKPPDKRRIKNSLACKLFDSGLIMIEVVTQDGPVAVRSLGDHFFKQAARHPRNQS